MFANVSYYTFLAHMTRQGNPYNEQLKPSSSRKVLKESGYKHN